MRWLLKRWWFWGGVALLIGMVLLAVFNLRPHRVTEANLDRIMLGMSRSQVEEILGPCTDESHRTEKQDGISDLFWLDGPDFLVTYFKEGKVVGREIKWASIRERFSWHFDQLRRKLGP